MTGWPTLTQAIAAIESPDRSRLFCAACMRAYEQRKQTNPSARHPRAIGTVHDDGTLVTMHKVRTIRSGEPIATSSLGTTTARLGAPSDHSLEYGRVSPSATHAEILCAVCNIGPAVDLIELRFRARRQKGIEIPLT